MAFDPNIFSCPIPKANFSGEWVAKLIDQDTKCRGGQIIRLSANRHRTDFDRQSLKYLIQIRILKKKKSKFCR
jgi:hypothetical protein